MVQNVAVGGNRKIERKRWEKSSIAKSAKDFLIFPVI